MKASGTSSKRKTLNIIKKIIESLNGNMLALEIKNLPGLRFAMQLKPEYTNIARKFSLRPLMSRAELKTLTHIAYLQPVSGSELSAKRGPQAYTHLRRLRELGFITQDRSGRNNIYRTTNIFSEYFGLSMEPERIKRELFNNKGNGRI